jgi:Homeodomain-like domain
MSEAISLAEAASHRDPEVGLAAVAALPQMVEQLEALQVKAAREDGWTWERVADALGITRQSVDRKYASRRFPGRRRT